VSAQRLASQVVGKQGSQRETHDEHRTHNQAATHKTNNYSYYCVASIFNLLYYLTIKSLTAATAILNRNLLAIILKYTLIALLNIRSRERNYKQDA
jgi:hypothetical protein